MRGHVLTTTGKRLEDVGLPDFVDLVYTYSINAPSERNAMRTAMLNYVFDLKTEEQRQAEDMSFDGFQRSSMSMLDELDDLHSMMSGVE